MKRFLSFIYYRILLPLKDNIGAIGATSDLSKTLQCTNPIVTAFTIAKFGADDDTADVASGATDYFLGVFQHVTKAAGDAVEIMVDGITNLVYGGVVTRGDPVTSDANGCAVKAVYGDNVIGYAMVSGVANDIGVVDIEQHALETNAGVDGLHLKCTFRATLNATGGLAQGKHGLGVYLPDNAIITRTAYVVDTTFQSATDAGTIALGEDTDDEDCIKAAVAISNGANAFDAGKHEGIQDGAAANFALQTTAKRQLVATIAVEDLTAGKLTIFGEYVIGN